MTSAYVNRLVQILLVVAVLGFAFSFTLKPYDFEHPKRMVAMHTVREFHNMTDFYVDSGIWTVTMDDLGMNVIRYPYLSEIEYHAPGCHGLYCDLPFFFPIRDIYGGPTLSWYHPGPPPKLPFQPKLNFVSSYDAKTNVRRVNGSIEGTSHNNLFIESHTKLKRWSFLDHIPVHDRESFFVFLASSKQQTKWNFWLELEGNETIELAFSSHFLDTVTPELTKFHNRLPNYVDDFTWVTYWARWTL